MKVLLSLSLVSDVEVEVPDERDGDLGDFTERLGLDEIPVDELEKVLGLKLDFGILRPHIVIDEVDTVGG